MEEQVRHMPKVELHCHLDGSISLDTIRELAKMEGISLPTDSMELKSLVTAPQDCKSLKQYLNCFGIAISCMQTEETLRLAALRLLEEAAAEHVIYIEVRFAPHLHREKGLSCRQVIESVLSGLRQAREEYLIEYGLILCAMRNESMENAYEILELAEEFRDKGVVAIDLAGNEADYPVTIFKDVFREAATNKVPFTIHAGEAAGAESVRSAIELGASRIGHGIAVCRDRGLIKECRDRGIAFELCPSSNLQTKAASGWAEYPFPMFYNAGLKLTVNTDNRRVTETSLTKEFALLGSHYGITLVDMKVLTSNAINAAFVNEQIKQFLRGIIEKP